MAPIGAVDTFCINELQLKGRGRRSNCPSSLPVQFPDNREKYREFVHTLGKWVCRYHYGNGQACVAHTKSAVHGLFD